MPKSFDYRFTVTLADTDAAGVLFFAHLFRHAHDAYERLLGEIGVSLPRLLSEAQYHLPLVHAEADYDLPIHHGQEITVRLEVAAIGRCSFTLAYSFEGEGQALHASAKTVHVAVGAADKAPIPLPASLVAALDPYCRPDRA